jgi:hypothetical protein
MRKKSARCEPHVEAGMWSSALESCKNRWKAQKKGYKPKHVTL